MQNLSMKLDSTCCGNQAEMDSRKCSLFEDKSKKVCLDVESI